MKKVLLNIFLLTLIFIGYPNLVNAISVSTVDELSQALKSGGEVKLEADIDNLATIEIPSGIIVTLDLNGHNIQAGLKLPDRHYYAIDNYGTFTLKDSIGSGYISARGIENLGTGIMTIESGEIRSIDTNGGAAIWNEATLVINDGIFKVTYVGTPNDLYGAGCLNNRENATVTINGGIYDSVNRRTYAVTSIGNMIINNNPIVTGAHGALGIDGGTAVVNGGTYTSTEYYGLYVSNDGIRHDSVEAQVVVNGGIFDGNIYSSWIGSDVSDQVNSIIRINEGVFKKGLVAQNNINEGGIDVKGGTFQGSLIVQQGGNQDSIKVTGGNFTNIDVEPYVQNGYTIYDTPDYYVVDIDSDITISKEKIYLKSGETYENIYDVLSTKYTSINLSENNIVKFNNNSIIAEAPGKVNLDITLNKHDNPITKNIEIIVYDVKPTTVDTNLNASTTKNSENTIKDTLNQIVESTLSSSSNIQGVSKELSNNIKENINKGNTISSKLLIKEATESNFVDEIKIINDKINKKIVNYYDISVVVTSNGKVIGNITEFDKKINITLPLPKNLPKVKNGYNRIYTVTRIHDGKVVELEATLNDDNTVSFESDKYSLFALSYQDILVDELDDVPNTGYYESNNLNESIIILILIVLAFSSLIGIHKLKKEN